MAAAFALEFHVASLETSGIRIRLTPGAQGDGASKPAAAGAWSLAPLAAAEGTIRAEIVDAQLLFDADVTVPIRAGEVDLGDASVEHVGPDSRLGVSRLGLYVDAPNGRSYLFQFASAPVDGVEYERRGALLGPWVTDRGRLRLQPFAEWLMRQGGGTPGMTLTQQARQLLARTAVSGEVQLGDGRFAAPGLQADFAGSADGHNKVRIHSDAVGRGLTLELPTFRVRDVVLEQAGQPVRCDEVTGAATLRVTIEDGSFRLALEIARMKVSGLGGEPR